MEKNLVVAYQIRFLPVCGGDALTTLMLSQLFYWYSPNKSGKSKLQVDDNDGVYWLAKSMKSWTEETGLSPAQARRALDHLEKIGLITTKLMRFDGAPTLHVRFVFSDGKAPLKSEKEVIHFWKSLNQIDEKAKFTTEITSETTAGETKAQASPSLEDEDEPSLEVKMKADDVLKKMATKTPIHPSFLWMKRMTALSDGVVKALTIKEQAQLKGISKALGVAKGTEVIDWALQHWKVFALEAAVKKGLAVTPSEPVPGFLLQHYDVALTLMEKKAAPVQLIAKTVVLEKVVVKEEDKATDADISATLALLKAKKLEKLSKE